MRAFAPTAAGAGRPTMASTNGLPVPVTQKGPAIVAWSVSRFGRVPSVRTRRAVGRPKAPGTVCPGQNLPAESASVVCSDESAMLALNAPTNVVGSGGQSMLVPALLASHRWSFFGPPTQRPEVQVGHAVR